MTCTLLRRMLDIGKYLGLVDGLGQHCRGVDDCADNHFGISVQQIGRAHV